MESSAKVARNIFRSDIDSDGVAPLLNAAESIAGTNTNGSVHQSISQAEVRIASLPVRAFRIESASANQETEAPINSLEHVSALGGYGKRALDIAIAATALILLSPLLAIVATLIAVSLKRPIIFTHERVGLGRRPFACLKFRTMVHDADAVLERHLAANPTLAEEWRKTQKLANDPRVTMLGRLLRKSSIDELPQLINVLRGDMSCIGPRPVVADELKRYGANAADYIKTRPGMTGLWQISGRNALSYEDRVALDSEYVRTWSILGDLKILFMTVPAVLRFTETA